MKPRDSMPAGDAFIKAAECPADSCQRDLSATAGANKPVGPAVDGFGVECQPLSPEIEARMASEVRGLVAALVQFAGRTKLIHEEIPAEARFGKAIAFFLSCCGFQFANTLGLSLVRGIFRDGGREYISQLDLDVKDLFREVSLDGRRFLAVALTDEGERKVFDGASTGDRQ